MTALPRENIRIGVDLGDRYSQLCTVDRDGEQVATARVRTTPAALEQWFRGQAPARVVLEAGTHSPWASGLLSALGHEVLVANPRKLRLIYENDRKDDRVDAQYLARVGRLDPKLLGGITHRGEMAQADLALLQGAECPGADPHAAGKPRAGREGGRRAPPDVRGRGVPSEGGRGGPGGAPVGAGASAAAVGTGDAPGSRLLDLGLLLVASAVCLALYTFGVEALASPKGTLNGIPTVRFFIFGSSALMASAGDLRMIQSGGVQAIRGVPRVARHLWRMCFALLIAAFSFFLGQA